MKIYRCEQCKKEWNENQLPQQVFQKPFKLVYFCPSCKSFELLNLSRKTRDCWRFYLDYGQGWEHEITEYTIPAMRENKKAYQENCNYPLRVVKGHEKI